MASRVKKKREKKVVHEYEKEVIDHDEIWWDCTYTNQTGEAYVGETACSNLSKEAVQQEARGGEGVSAVVKDIDFEEALTCTICQSTYTDPHILSCLHSFCKSCLSKHISATKVRGSYGSNKIKCPLCRSEHSLSAKGVDDLMPNTQLARKVEDLPENLEMVRQQCDQCEAH